MRIGCRSLSLVCDDFHLYESALGEFSNRHTGAGGLGSEELAIDSVEGRKVGHIGEEACGLDHIGLIETGFGQDGLDVLHDPIGLERDVSGFQSAGGRVNGHHAREIQEVSRPDCLRVGTDGSGGVRGGYAIEHSRLLS